MKKEEFASLLNLVEFGVIGKRELIDILKALRMAGEASISMTNRCAGEFLRRFPLDRRSPRLIVEAAMSYWAAARSDVDQKRKRRDVTISP